MSRLDWVVALIVLIFVILGLTYSLVNPIFEAPDESFHFAYIQHLASGQGLPVQDPEDPGPWRQEGNQPPLYYLLGALLTFWLDTSDVLTYMRYNPHAAGGHPEADGNRNLFLHTPAESFPYRGTVLAVHLLRLFSVLLGATTVILVYRIAQEVFPERRTLVLLAPAIMAFNPQFLFISSAVNNDNLITALSGLTAYLALRLTPPPIPPRSTGGVGEGTSRYEAIALGLSLGLALLSKLSALTLLVIVAFVVGLEAWRQRSWRFLVVSSLIVFGLATAVAGWWYWRNWRLYGDPTGLNAMLLVATPRDLSWRGLLSELQGIVLSFWAVFGWFNILADPAVYWFVQVLLGLGLVGLAVFLTRQRPGGRVAGHLGLLALWLAAMIGSLFRWTMMTMGSQGRLLFPAVPAIGLFLALGLLELVPQRYERLMAVGVAGSLLTIAAISPFRYIAPAYARPPVLSQFDAATIPHPVHITYGDQPCPFATLTTEVVTTVVTTGSEGQAEACRSIELLGYELDDKGAKPGESFHITLYWRALRPIDQAYSVYIHLRTLEGELISQRDSYPGRGSYPTFLWQPGQVVVDTYRLDIPRDIDAPATGRIEVGLYTIENFQNLPAYDGQGNAITPVIGRFKVRAPHISEVLVANPVDVTFADQVALAGWKADRLTVVPGETLNVLLIWKALTSMDTDYTVFVHLVEAPGRPPLAQADGEPQGGGYPTSLWDPGEMVRDERLLAIPPDLAPGEYRLVVGMYQLTTGDRLPVAGGGDYVELTPVEVRP